MAMFYGDIVIGKNALFVSPNVEGQKCSFSRPEVYVIPGNVYDIVKEHVKALNFEKMLNVKDKEGNSSFWENDCFGSLVNSICSLEPGLDKNEVENALSMCMAECDVVPELEKRHTKRNLKPKKKAK